MGTCTMKPEPEKEMVFVTMNKSMFKFHYSIGRGGFSRVWKVEKKKERQLFALKEMSKARILTKKSVHSVMNERRILGQLRHPLIINMEYAFQDKENLFLVLDYMEGGDLRYHICRNRKFSEKEAKFMVACLVCALEYIHSKGIIHRDVKPENLVFDSRGFLHLTDFGVARVWNPNNSNDTSGTPGYMAPEVMCRSNHGVAADYFAVGVIAYECMMGRRPYLGRTRKEIRDQILAKQAQIKPNELPKGWSISALSFINKLLKRKPLERLGANGPREIKNHPWLHDFPWPQLLEKSLPSPYVPNCKNDNFDSRCVKENWKDDEELLKQSTLLLENEGVQAQFKDYYYDSELTSKGSYSYRSQQTSDTFVLN